MSGPNKLPKGVLSMTTHRAHHGTSPYDHFASAVHKIARAAAGNAKVYIGQHVLHSVVTDAQEVFAVSTTNGHATWNAKRCMRRALRELRDSEGSTT